VDARNIILGATHEAAARFARNGWLTSVRVLSVGCKLGVRVTLFDDWCTLARDENGEKRLWRLAEKENKRARVRLRLVEIVRSHYDGLDRIADDVDALGYEGAAKILRERLPQTRRARSGELGEILAAELVEEKVGFRIPVRRLRYKDGRDMALRGDDFLGIATDDEDRLRLLKGESKSAATVGKKTVGNARKALSSHDGRPTPISLLFVADRLIEAEGAEGELGRLLRNEVAEKSIPPSRIDHALFTLSGNDPTGLLTEDLEGADSKHGHTVVNLRIEDHQDFIADIYDGALALGDG
jgi:hypothetical protein